MALWLTMALWLSGSMALFSGCEALCLCGSEIPRLRAHLTTPFPLSGRSDCPAGRAGSFRRPGRMGGRGPLRAKRRKGVVSKYERRLFAAVDDEGPSEGGRRPGRCGECVCVCGGGNGVQAYVARNAAAAAAAAAAASTAADVEGKAAPDGEPTLPATHSPTHPLNHSLTHSRTYARTHPSTHPHTHSLTHPPTHPPTHSRTHALTHVLTHSLTRSLTHPRR